jgi:site-specific recombinase XerD
MASIFKRSGARKTDSYWIQYTDHNKKRKTAKGFTDKGLTEELAAKLEGKVRMVTSGLVDHRHQRLAEHAQAPIEHHLTEFENSLQPNTDKHVTLTMFRVRRIVTGCKFEKLGDVEGSEVRKFLWSLHETKEIGNRTYNHYLQAFESFLIWCVENQRLAVNPLANVERLNNEVDVRHPRRALTPAEITKLVTVTRASAKSVQRVSPELRARAYLFSYLTGLRKKEMGSLTASSFRLDDEPPKVTLAAACSKHRRTDVLPLHPKLVEILRIWLAGLSPTDKLFPGLERKKMSEMIQKDLKRAGIPYRTADGIADFHAAGRHTYITQLLRNGVTLPEAKELARHSDVKMTMRYTHIGIHDQARAVAKLPAAALHMRCVSGGSEGHPVTPPDGRPKTKRIDNPCRDNNIVTDRRRSTPSDRAEGTGLEPATPCGATDFESVC